MTTHSYFQHRRYQLATRHFQRGEWKAGLAEMERLIQIFPMDHELRSLRKELLFKERIDGDRIGERAAGRRRRLSLLAMRMVAITVLVVAGYLAFSTYSGWMGEQLTTARQRVELEIRSATLAAKQRDTEALMQVGRLAEAQVVLGEIAELDPEFPGLVQLGAELAAGLELANLYEQGLRQIDAADWLGANASFELLNAKEPNYRDVGHQMMYIDRQTQFGNLISEGESAMARAEWEQAVAAFDAVRKLHPEQEPEYVEAQLFESLVNAGRAVLIGQEDSLAALEQAEAHLRKALALRPQDPDIKRERELAGLYLKAQADFEQGNWSEVIDALGRTVNSDPGYAQGTARQTLYDAYVARGEHQMAIHSYQGALNDYERAVALGKQDEKSALRLYEAELKVAEAYGATGNFEAAVVHYRAAAEWGSLAKRGSNNSALLSALQEAEVYAAAGNFGVAYKSFQRAVSLANANQITRTHVVKEGEYLTLLASRYGSTVRAIALASGIENDNLIFPGQELLIPVLP
jgi:tetratricopeptide (TPR) repeat protein